MGIATFFRRPSEEGGDGGRKHGCGKYLKAAVQIVGGGAASWAVMKYGPDATVDGLISMIPLTVSMKGLNSLTNGIHPTRMEVENVIGRKNAGHKILTVRVDGVIMGDVKRNPLSSVVGTPVISGYDIQDTLMKAAQDRSIDAVLIQFSTPGGVVHGAQAISDGIIDYRQITGKPVVAHVEGMSASGGVWAMVAANEVYAEPGSLTGSIGVTLGTRHWYDNPTAVKTAFGEGVETAGGVQSYALVAGRGKDLLSPWRKPEAGEIQTIQSQLDVMYNEFVEHIVEHRPGMDEDTIRQEMGAYIFGNEDAEDFGLIDGTMTRRELIQHLTDVIGADAEDVAVVREKTKKSRIAKLVGAQSLCGVTAVYDGPGASGFFAAE